MRPGWRDHLGADGRRDTPRDGDLRAELDDVRARLQDPDRLRLSADHVERFLGEGTFFLLWLEAQIRDHRERYVR